MTELISFEYLQYLEKYVYVKYEITEKKQVVPVIGAREFIWGKWSWSDSSVGPWEEFRSMVFGGFNP